MEKQKKKQNGITLIALVISIIVMLILAGVSLNLTVGDNGIITNAMNAKIKSSLAILQEEMNSLKIKKMENNDLSTIEVIDFSYEDYPTTGFLHRVNYGGGETYVFDMNYIDRVNSELKNVLSGGYGENGTIYQLKDVYGINEDFTVWYRDKDGNLYGVDEIKEVAIDPETKVNMSQGLMESMGLTKDTANVGNTRGKTVLEIDGSKMTTPITNLDDLSLMPNLTWLKLKDLTLDNIKGLQYLRQLNKITFDNTTVTDVSGLQYANLVTGVYLINGSVSNSNIATITSKFTSMSQLEIVRIRNNDGLTSIPALSSLGSASEVWIEENKNLTNIYGLSTVTDKSKLQRLYLVENNLTDVVTTSNTHESYEYILPLNTSGNIINLSYLNGYSQLRYLNLAQVGGGNGVVYEDGENDQFTNSNSNQYVHYLNSIDSTTGELYGISNLTNLEELNLSTCDIYDLETIFNLKDYVLRKLNILNSSNLKNAQVNYCLGLFDLMSASDLKLSGKYANLISNNKETLNFGNSDIDNLDFLEGNIKVKKLSLSNCTNLTNSCTTVLGSLTQLTNLNMEGCSSITDFSFLANLPSLTILTLDKTKVSDSAIMSLPNKNKIVSLNIAYCPYIKNASTYSAFNLPLQKWGIYAFDIRGCGISNTADLSFLNDAGYTQILFGGCGDITTCQQAISACTEYIFVNSALLTKLAECTEITSLRMRDSRSKY